MRTAFDKLNSILLIMSEVVFIKCAIISNKSAMEMLWKIPNMLSTLCLKNIFFYGFSIILTQLSKINSVLFWDCLRLNLLVLRLVII